MNDHTHDMQHDSGLRLGVAAELAKRYGADERDFLRALAAMLERALPDDVQIERTGWFGKGPVKRLSVTLGDNIYALEDLGRGPLQATRARIVRGITLKTDAVAVAPWIEELGAALQERAQTSEAARDALSRLTEF